MKFWTVQTNDVVKIVRDKGIFQPNFSKSRYLQINSNLEKLYNFVLRSFNTVNNMDLPGLVYAFAQSDGRVIYSIEDFNEFRAFINDRSDVIGGFWRGLEKSDVAIVELIYDESFNPIFVDINDFQFLMPPIIPVAHYSKESIERIYRDIHAGKITTSEFPSNVIQAHLPYIKSENIINTYPIFELD